MKTRLIIMTVMLSLLAGCMVGPNYRRPVVKAPEVFRGAPMPPRQPTLLRWLI